MQEDLDFIQLALAEDVGDGDHSSLACIESDKQGKAIILAKQQGIIAGLALAKIIFGVVDKKLICSPYARDGDSVSSGQELMQVAGSAQSLLKAERLVLNCMQRMSGIATETQKYVARLKGLRTIVLDTRKTTPGFRKYEKQAVVLGGGQNHRMGLYDMIMLKDNHIDHAGGIEKAIAKTSAYVIQKGLQNLKIEIETRNLDEVQQVMECGQVHRIMLDNFNIADLTKAVKLINKIFETEASGGITLDTIRSYAETGVDYISVGALTHSYTSMDISMKTISR